MLYNVGKLVGRRVLFGAAAAGALFVFAMAPAALAQTAIAGPRITSIYPASGPVGTQVTVYGSGLSGVDVVSFGPGIIPLDGPISSDGSQFTFTIPATLATLCSLSSSPCSESSITIFPAVYSVSAATIALDYSLGPTSNSANFTVTPSVVITSITPSQGTIGTKVTITGSGFSTYANAIDFTAGSVEGVIPQIGNSSSVIQFVIPQGWFPRCAVTYPPCPPSTFAPPAGIYSVSIAPNFDFSQRSNSVSFNLPSGLIASPIPVITSVIPSVGTIGTQVTIKGYNFSPNLNIIDFGIGIATAKVVGGDLVFNIPTMLGPRCAFFGNPPCATSSTVPMVPGTYQMSVAASPTMVSSPATLIVNSIPLPTTPPVIATSSANLGVKAVSALNIRTAPSISASIVGTEDTGSLGLVESGPVSADGYAWYDVDWSDGFSGWSAGKYLLAVSQSLCPITLGDSVEVFSGGQDLTLYVRSTPSLTGNIAAVELSGTRGTVASGPVVADLYNWWNIRFPDGVSGWIAESNFTDVQCLSLPTSTPTLSSNPQGPTVSFITPQNGATVAGQVPLTVVASSSFPITGVSFYVDGTIVGTATAAPYTATWNAGLVYNGYHAIKAQVNTSAGISGQASISVNVTGGLTIPIVTITAPTGGATVSGTVPLVASVSSSLAIAGVDFSIDGTIVGTATVAPYRVLWDATKVYNGYHTLVATARTVPGTSGSTQIGLYVTGGLVINTPPNIDITFITPQAGATVSGSVPITVTVSSSISIVSVSFYADSQLIGTARTPPYTVSWDATQALNGWHTISAVAQASNGYNGGKSITVNVTGGLSYPVVTFVAPAAGTTVSGQVPVSVTVSATRPAMTEVDIYDGGLLIGTSSAASYTATWDTTKVYNGSHTLVATARTTNTAIAASKTLTVNVAGGLAPPAISVAITAPKSGATVFGKIPISATVSSTDPISEVDFYQGGALIGAAKAAPYAITWDATQATPGNYFIVATAKTATGVSATVSVSVNVIAPPVFSLGEKVMVQTDSKVGLNARSGPSTSYPIVGTESNGATGVILNSIPVFADTYNWWDVKYADGVSGWSAEPYLVAAP